VAVWRTSNVVRHFNEVTLRQVRLVLGWVTIFGWANHRSIPPIHPGQLSLPPSAGREMSTSQSVVMLCSWAVKAGMVAHSTCGQQVKLCDPSLTHALPEHFRDVFLVIKCFINLRLLYFSLHTLQARMQPHLKPSFHVKIKLL